MSSDKSNDISNHTVSGMSYYKQGSLMIYYSNNGSDIYAYSQNDNSYLKAVSNTQSSKEKDTE